MSWLRRQGPRGPGQAAKRDLVGHVAGALALLACVWTLIALNLAEGSRAAEQAIHADTQSLAALIAEQTSRVLMAADDLLGFVADEFVQPRPVDHLAGRVRSGSLRLHDLVLVSIVDDAGRLIQTNQGPADPSIDLSDREPIDVHLDSRAPADAMFIGKTVRGRSSGQWSLQLTRAIKAPDGSVKGVVVGTLEPRSFKKFWPASMWRGGKSVELVGKDGHVRALNADLDEALEGDPQRADVIARIGTAKSGQLRVPSGPGGDEAIMHFRQIGDMPLYLTLTSPSAQFRQAFMPMRKRHLALGVLTSLTIVAFASIMMRRAHQLIERRQDALIARQRLDDAVSAMPDGFALFDASDRLVVFNDAYRRIYGLSGDLVRPGVTFETLIREGARRGQYSAAIGRTEEWVQERLHAHRNPEGAFEQQVDDGRWLRIEERRTTDGGIVGIRADITAIKQRELDLARQAAMLRMTFDNMSEGLSVVDEAGFLVAHNRLFQKFLDLPDSLVAVESSLLELLARSAQNDKFRDKQADAEATYVQSLHLPGRPVLWKREDGREIEFRSSRLRDGRIVTMYGDVTDRSRSERSLRFSEAQKSAMISSSLDGIIVIDDTGRITEFNEAAEQIFGWSKTEIIGRSVADTIIPHDHCAKPSAALERDPEDRTPGPLNQRIEIVAQRRNGELFPAELTMAAIRIDQRDLFSTYIRDISDSKRLDQERRAAQKAAEAANRAKSEFLAMVSHEVRTPLNGIVGFTGLLRTTALTAEQSKFSQGVEDASKRLLRLINEILDFSKIDAGRLAFEPAPFDVGELVGSAIEMTQALAVGKSVVISATIAAEVSSVLIGDSARVSQILQNLLANSAKFTEQGSVTVQVAASEHPDGRERLSFDVTDTGPGIAVDRQNGLFQPFEQGGAEIARQYGGSGLGLSISRKLAQLMGGSVDLVDSTSSGSTFRAVVLLERGKPDDLAPPAQPAVQIEVSTPPMQILVAEDTPTNQIVVRAMLERMGHWVQVVGNGVEAVDALRQRRFDVVLMDMQMPLLDGCAAARQIRTLSGPSAATPIVAITAQAREQDLAAAQRAGIERYLVKPITMAGLQSALAQIARRTEPDAGAHALLPCMQAQQQLHQTQLLQIDADALHELESSVGVDTFRQLVEGFSADCATELQHLGTALAQSDADLMRRSAHKLAGLFGQFGLPGAQHCAQQIEQSLEPSECSAHASDLVDIGAKAVAALQESAAA